MIQATTFKNDCSSYGTAGYYTAIIGLRMYYVYIYEGFFLQCISKLLLKKLENFVFIF